MFLANYKINSENIKKQSIEPSVHLKIEYRTFCQLSLNTQTKIPFHMNIWFTLNMILSWIWSGKKGHLHARTPESFFHFVHREYYICHNQSKGELWGALTIVREKEDIGRKDQMSRCEFAIIIQYCMLSEMGMQTLWGVHCISWSPVFPRMWCTFEPALHY